MGTNEAERICDVVSTFRALPPWVPPASLLVSVPVFFYGLASFSIHLGDGVNSVPLYWPANALVFTALVRRPTREWPALLLLAAAADFLVYLPLFGVAMAAWVSAADATEILVVACVAGFFPASLRKLSTSQLFLVFGGTALGCAVGATIGVGSLYVEADRPIPQLWLVWTASSLLGYLTLAPALLLFTDRDFRPERNQRYWKEAAFWAALLAVVSYLVFRTELPAAFLVFPIMLSMTFRLRLRGAAASTLIVALISSWLTMEGSGPIATGNLAANAQIHVLQAFLFVCFLTTFPIGIVMERDKLLAAAIAEARAQAEDAGQARGDFLAVVSHEIRTPLNGILGFANLLLDDLRLNKSQRHQVGIIQTSGMALLTLVNDILDFSKIDARALTLEHKPFKLEAFVANSVAIVRGEAEEKGLTMQVSFDDDLARWYSGDEHRLRQILLNLLNNAVKFTDSGSVRLKVCREDSVFPGRDAMRFEVSDTGPGLDTEQQKRLFKPFSQLDSSIRRKYGGSGLGLSISKRLVELMGGEIGVKGELGQGSTFWFSVTLSRAQAPGSPVGTEPSAIARPAKILVAEDLPVNQELICAMLHGAGHSVDVANDGEEAVAAVQNKQYDLVLMDIQMPRLDGLSAARAIRKLPPPANSVPIVAMTAHALSSQIAETQEAGMKGHITKPIFAEELNRAIAAVLGTSGQDVTAATPSEKEEAQGESFFDENIYQGVRASLPPERLKTYLQSLDQQLARALGDSSSDEGLESAAHNIVSQAGMLGFMKMSVAAGKVEEAVRDGKSAGQFLRQARAEATKARRRLRSLIDALDDAKPRHPCD